PCSRRTFAPGADGIKAVVVAVALSSRRRQARIYVGSGGVADMDPRRVRSLATQSTRSGHGLDHNPAMRRPPTRVSCAIFWVGDARTRPVAHLDFGKVWAQGRLNLNKSESVDAPPTAAAVHSRDRRAEGAPRRRCLEHARSRPRRPRLYRQQ